MISREQDTKERLTELSSFKRTDSERLQHAKEQQAALEEAQHQQDLKVVGLLIIVAFVAFLAGVAI